MKNLLDDDLPDMPSDEEYEEWKKDLKEDGIIDLEE